MTKDEAIKIMNDVLNNLGITAYELSKQLGMTRPQGLYDVMNPNKDTVKISKNLAEKIITTFPQFNEGWLLTGKGDMLKNTTASQAVVIAKGKRAEMEPGEIPLIPYEIVEKIGLDNYLAAIERGYERYIVPEFSNADFLTRMNGNTMYPKYSSGDVIACKHLPLDTFYQWNKIYAFSTNQGLIIKRVHEGTDNDHLTLISDNERYPAFQISRAHIIAHALVLGSIRLD